MFRDMGLILFMKISQGGQDRVWRRFSQAAERALLDICCQFLKELDVAGLALASGDVFEYIQHLRCAQAAEGALAA